MRICTLLLALLATALPAQDLVVTDGRFMRGGEPFYLAGSGGPEGFLYLPPAEQQAIIAELDSYDVNGLYLMAVRSDGGDGDSDENPWIGNDPDNGLDPAVLDAWGVLFDELNSRGMVVYFLFYDDGARPFGTGSSMSAAEEAFVREIVQRFSYLELIVWVVGEEWSEALSSQRVSQIAATIREEDPVHPIGVHQLSRWDDDFPNDPTLDHVSLQVGSKNERKTFEDAEELWTGVKNFAVTELKDGGTFHYELDLDDFRQHNWAIALGGMDVMVHKWYEPTGGDPDPARLELLQIQSRFLNSGVRLDLLTPDGSRFAGDASSPMAAVGDGYYLAYGDGGTVGWTGMLAGDYTLHWVDIANGNEDVSQVTLSSGTNTFSAPGGIGSEAVLYAFLGDPPPPPVCDDPADPCWCEPGGPGVGQPECEEPPPPTCVSLELLIDQVQVYTSDVCAPCQTVDFSIDGQVVFSDCVP